VYNFSYYYLSGFENNPDQRFLTIVSFYGFDNTRTLDLLESLSYVRVNVVCGTNPAGRLPQEGYTNRATSCTDL